MENGPLPLSIRGKDERGGEVKSQVREKIAATEKADRQAQVRNRAEKPIKQRLQHAQCPPPGWAELS